MEKIYREIIHLLHQVGELVKEELAQQDVVVSTKSSRSDLVTNIDKSGSKLFDVIFKRINS
ncbi:hypothetical protein V4S28_06385 [Enterococcus cecorum]